MGAPFSFIRRTMEAKYGEEPENILVRIYVRETPSEVKLCSPAAVFDEMKEIGKADQESLWIIMLNTKNMMIRKEMVSLGTIDCANADIRIIFRRLFQYGAPSFVMCHNHPSGDALPSADDIRLTKKTKDVAELMEFKLVDHIIIGDGGYFSFVEKNIL